jgi:hypothetical protein
MPKHHFDSRSEVLRVMRQRTGLDITSRRKQYKGIPPLTIEQANRAFDQVFDNLMVFNTSMSDYYRLDDTGMTELIEQIQTRHEWIKTNHLDKFHRATGRSPQMYYQDYLRGWGMERYLLCRIVPTVFVSGCEIRHVGDDTGDAFLKTHKADGEVVFSSQDIVRVEIQTGLGDGFADIKKPKIQEAQRQMADSRIETVLIHLDMVEGFGFIMRGVDQIRGPFEKRQGYNEDVWNMRDMPVWRWPLDPIDVWPNLPCPIGA